MKYLHIKNITLVMLMNMLHIYLNTRLCFDVGIKERRFINTTITFYAK